MTSHLTQMFSRCCFQQYPESGILGREKNTTLTKSILAILIALI